MFFGDFGPLSMAFLVVLLWVLYGFWWFKWCFFAGFEVVVGAFCCFFCMLFCVFFAGFEVVFGAFCCFFFLMFFCFFLLVLKWFLVLFDFFF